MRLPFKRRDERSLERMFETRSHAWAAVGLEVEVDRKKIRKAWERMALCVPLVIAVAVGEHLARNDRFFHTGHGHDRLNGFGVLATAAAVLVILALGWLISRDLSRLAPLIFRRMDPALPEQSAS